MNKSNLDKAIETVRKLAIEFDEGAQTIQEGLFQQWQVDTVYPEAVNLWIQEACHV